MSCNFLCALLSAHKLYESRVSVHLTGDAKRVNTHVQDVLRRVCKLDRDMSMGCEVVSCTTTFYVRSINLASELSSLCPASTLKHFPAKLDPPVL